MTEAFVEQPLAFPGSANYLHKIKREHLTVGFDIIDSKYNSIS